MWGEKKKAFKKRKQHPQGGAQVCEIYRKVQEMALQKV